MFKTITSKVKNFLEGGIFSSSLMVPLTKYRKNYSKGDFLTSYEICLYLNKALERRAEKVSEIKFTVSVNGKNQENHEVLDLLNKPNNLLSGTEFWKLAQKYYDIYGEVYILKDQESLLGGKTRVRSIHLLSSDRVMPIFDDSTGEIKKVEYQTGNGTIIYDGEEILYHKNPSPRNMLRGESLIAAGIRQIETGIQIDEYHSKILENGGRVDSIFNFKSKLSKKQMEEMRDTYQENYGSSAKSGLPMFLGGDVSYERMGLNPEELSYLETKKINFDDIIILTSVPKSMLGLTSGETFSNADASIRIFLREVVNPIMCSLVNALSEDPTLTDKSTVIGYIDPTPEDKEEKRKDVESGINNYYMTINEARKINGLDPIANGDDILKPFNIMPLRSEQVVKNNNTEKIKSLNHPLKSRKNREVYHALCVKRLDSRQQKMKKVIADYFEDQQKRLVDQLIARKSFKQKNLIGELFILKLEIAIAKETVLPILSQMLKDAAVDAKEIAGSDWEYHETADIYSWLDKKTSVFAETINKTTFKKLQDEFTQSLDAGETREKLVERIENTYKNISTARAETIARTEVHGVTQYGTVQGYKQAGMSIKIWVWAPGANGGVREDHQAMDGEERPIGTAFSNGLDFPGDSSGSAEEVINCECFI